LQSLPVLPCTSPFTAIWPLPQAKILCIGEFFQFPGYLINQIVFQFNHQIGHFF
jgi:hypothetical protein